MRLRDRVREPAWLWVVLVGSVAAVSVIAMAASRLLIPAESAVIPTETWPWSAEGVGVYPLTPESPFRAGDIVVAVDGRPLREWADAALRPPWLFGFEALGSTVDMEVIRSGAPVRLVAPLSTLPLARLGAAPLALVAFSAATLLLTLVLVIRRPRAIVLRLLAIAVVCDVADIVAWEVGLQPTDLVVPTPFLYAFGVATVLGVVFWAALTHVLLLYPVRASWVVRHPRRIRLAYGLPLLGLAAGAVVAAIAGGGSLAWIGRLGPLSAAVVSVETAAVLVAIVAGYRRTPEPRRSQIRLIAVTLFAAAAASLLLFSLPLALSRDPLVPRSVVALLALPAVAAVGFAVVRDRLFQVDLLATSRARIVAAREEERLRLRRELHDGLGPSLAALGLKVDAARAAVDDDPVGLHPLLDEIRADVRTILTDVRGLARGLRPPSLDSLGLAGALRLQVEALTAGSGTSVTVADDGLPELPPWIEVAAYRIVTEAVANMVRHAGATDGTVRLIIDDDMLRIDVSDDGIGIEDSAIGVGTRSMYERAAEVGGELVIEPAEGGGTRLIAVLPVRTASSSA
jgi:signal transduction histidine kinase